MIIIINFFKAHTPRVPKLAKYAFYEAVPGECSVDENNLFLKWKWKGITNCIVYSSRTSFADCSFLYEIVVEYLLTQFPIIN